MPRKQQKKPQGDWKGFVQCNLGKQEKIDAKKWIEAQETSELEAIEPLVSDGYKVSFSQDGYHSAALCSISCVDPENTNYGFTLTGRAPDMRSALFMALYKHFIMLECDWSGREASSDRSDPWG